MTNATKEPSIRSIGANILKRKEHHRHVITYSIMLVGQDGLGKTTFANNLLDTPVFAHKYNELNADISLRSATTKAADGTSVKVVKPCKTVLYTGTSNLVESVERFDPASADKTSGSFQLQASTIEIKGASKEDDTLLLNILKTSGLDTSFDNEYCFTELSDFLEHQFDSVLAEETRIRRNPRFEDTRVHVALYFIEPNGHGLKELDVTAMKKLSKYTNVLPIISKSDSLTFSELKEFKSRVLSDLEYYNIPVYRFVSNDDYIEEDDEDINAFRNRNQNLDDQDIETVEDNQYLESLQPFAIICSDTKDKETGRYYRKYSWADTLIDIDDNKTSDLSVLKRVLFGSHLQDIKDTMANFLYENYRAKKLSRAIGSNSQSGDLQRSHSLSSTSSSVNINAQLTNGSTTPSLSNFQSLVINGQPSTYSLDMLAKSSKTTPSTIEDEKAEYEDAQEEGDDTVESIDTSSKVINGSDVTSHSSSLRDDHSYRSSDANLHKNQLRNISNTIPYQLKRDRILAQKQKLEELETSSAKELQRKIEELEKKAAELKKRERLLKLQREKNNSSSASSIKTHDSASTVPFQETELVAIKTEIKQEQELDGGLELTEVKQETISDNQDALSTGNDSVLKTDIADVI